MQIRFGKFDGIFAVFLACWLTVGCAQPGSGTVKKGTKKTPVPGQTTVAQLSREASASDLILSAEAIDAIAVKVESGEIKYDTQLAEALGKAFVAGQSSDANKRLNAVMAKALDPSSDTFDGPVLAKTLRQYAKGRRDLAGTKP